MSGASTTSRSRRDDGSGNGSDDGSGNGSDDVASAVRAESAALGESAADAGRDVAGAAAEQTARVTREARQQIEDLVEQARAQVTEQARQGQHKAGEALHAVAEELRQMADGAEGAGPVAGLAAHAADRVGGMARWLERREPGDVLDEVRDLARRRPGAFLAGAALAGVLAGRLTRGVVESGHDGSPGRGGRAGRPGSDTGAATASRAAGVPEESPVPAARPNSRATERDDGREPGPVSLPGVTTVGEYVEELERRGELEYPAGGTS